MYSGFDVERMSRVMYNAAASIPAQETHILSAGPG